VHQGLSSNMAINKEKRQFARVEVKWPATIITSDGQLVGETIDISQVGLSIYCKEALPIGQEFRLEIQPPNCQPITATAMAVWSMDTTFLERSRSFVMGAEFAYISEDDIRFLGEIIRNRPKERDCQQKLEHSKSFEKDRIDKQSEVVAAEKQVSGRIYPRFKVINWPATILTQDKVIDGIARNLSASGAYIYYEMPQNIAIPLPLNAQVALVIKVPDRFPLVIRSEVVWSRIINSNEGITLLGAGFGFTDIFFSDRQFLREMVAKYAW
jgi:hypothetical protein